MPVLLILCGRKRWDIIYLYSHPASYLLFAINYSIHMAHFYASQDVAKANMATVQAKLQECVNSGVMNSFDRISNLFSGNNNNNATTTSDSTAESRSADVVMKGTGSTGGKDSSKIPTKKTTKSSKYSNLGTCGGSSRGRNRSRNKSDRTESKRLRSSSKKGRGGKKLAMKI